MQLNTNDEQNNDTDRMTQRPWHGPNTVEVPITYDSTKVFIVFWEYSANGWDGPHTCLTMPTHSVAWMRPCFAQIDKDRS